MRRYKQDYKYLLITFGKLKVIGKKENVDAVLKEIDKIVQDYNEMKKAKKFFEFISGNIQWQVFLKGQWRVFSPILNSELEMKFMSCQKNGSKIRLLDENNCFFEADVKANKLSYDFDLGLKH
jgi:phosphodiesterase/alkaline phosphatase D-like protein